MKILVGSKNPVKISGTKLAFEQYFENIEIDGVAVESNVSNQPFNDEVLSGARNRIKNLRDYAKENNIFADYFVSIESGITDKFGVWQNINFAVITDKNGYESVGMSESFPIPQKYIEEIRKSELGVVMARLSNTENIKQKFGAVYFLTKRLTREDLVNHSVTMALTQFINKNLWRD